MSKEEDLLFNTIKTIKEENGFVINKLKEMYKDGNQKVDEEVVKELIRDLQLQAPYNNIDPIFMINFFLELSKDNYLFIFTNRIDSKEKMAIAYNLLEPLISKEIKKNYELYCNGNSKLHSDSDLITNTGIKEFIDSLNDEEELIYSSLLVREVYLKNYKYLNKNEEINITDLLKYDNITDFFEDYNLNFLELKNALKSLQKSNYPKFIEVYAYCHKLIDEKIAIFLNEYTILDGKRETLDTYNFMMDHKISPQVLYKWKDFDNANKKINYNTEAVKMLSRKFQNKIHFFNSVQGSIESNYSYKGIETTLEERTRVIEYLEKRNIPVCSITFRNTLNKYLDGDLVLNKNIDKEIIQNKEELINYFQYIINCNRDLLQSITNTNDPRIEEVLKLIRLPKEFKNVDRLLLKKLVIELKKDRLFKLDDINTSIKTKEIIVNALLSYRLLEVMTHSLEYRKNTTKNIRKIKDASNIKEILNAFNSEGSQKIVYYDADLLRIISREKKVLNKVVAEEELIANHRLSEKELFLMNLLDYNDLTELVNDTNIPFKSYVSKLKRLRDHNIWKFNELFPHYVKLVEAKMAEFLEPFESGRVTFKTIDEYIYYFTISQKINPLDLNFKLMGGDIKKFSNNTDIRQRHSRALSYVDNASKNIFNVMYKNQTEYQIISSKEEDLVKTEEMYLYFTENNIPLIQGVFQMALTRTIENKDLLTTNEIKTFVFKKDNK